MDGKYVRSEFIVPRCTDACPAGVDVPRYIRAVKDGQYDEAVFGAKGKNSPYRRCARMPVSPLAKRCVHTSSSGIPLPFAPSNGRLWTRVEMRGKAPEKALQKRVKRQQWSAPAPQV